MRSEQVRRALHSLHLASALIVSLAGSVPIPADAGEIRFTLESAQPVYRLDAPMVLTWRLSNEMNQAVVVLACVQTPARFDFDPVTVHLEALTAPYAGVTTEIELIGKRTASLPVLRELEPGKSLAQSFDLSMFAAINGVHLSTGRYRITATYAFRDMSSVPEGQRAVALAARLISPPILVSIESSP
jgi:hypothetical protein